MLQQYVRGN